MKKILLIIFIYLFFSQVSANDWRAKKGSVINNEFKVNKNMILPLDEGEWFVIYKFKESITHGIGIEGITFVQMEDNTPVKFFEIARATGLSKWQAYLTSIIEAATFNTKEDGCRKRQHYNYLNFYKKGAAHNCMIVENLDVNRLLYPTEYDPDSVFRGGIRRWIEKEKIDIPKNYLTYSSSFFSISVRDEWHSVSYGVTPEKFAKYTPKYNQRDQSDFHPNNIKNYPRAKKIMDDWLIESANFHKKWEDFQKARKSQKIDLNNLLTYDIFTNSENSKKEKKSVANELIKINNLYKSGAITKEEFEKAKDKILK